MSYAYALNNFYIKLRCDVYFLSLILHSAMLFVKIYLYIPMRYMFHLFNFPYLLGDQLFI